jgi:hypothetical protein
MSIPQIPPEFDVRVLVRAGIDKRGRDVGPFETPKEAKKRSGQRFRLLCTDDKNDTAQILALTLFCCEKHARCESLACPVCSRNRRILSSAAVLHFLAQYDWEDLRAITLINPADALHVGDLHKFNPRKLINRFRRQLERAGLSKSKTFIVGFIDGEWDEGWQLFQPHLHLITHKDNISLLKTIVKTWAKDSDRVRLRMLTKKIYFLPRAVTYLDKSWWPSVARKNNPLEIHPHNKRRPPPEIEREILLWLDRYRTADLRLLYGVKAYHGNLVKS